MKMKTFTVIITIFFTLFLTSCSNDLTQDEPKTEEITVSHLKEMVHTYSVEEIVNETATITSTHLILNKQNGEEEIYALPEDEFFVSIAPFINETHPCKNHSLTGCQGEMVEKEFNVYIENEAGEVVVDENMSSLANGFIDLWLPRNKNYQITIEYNGLKGVGEFSTYEGDGTCITTIQLLQRELLK